MGCYVFVGSLKLRVFPKTFLQVSTREAILSSLQANQTPGTEFCSRYLLPSVPQKHELWWWLYFHWGVVIVVPGILDFHIYSHGHGRAIPYKYCRRNVYRSGVSKLQCNYCFENTLRPWVLQILNRFIQDDDEAGDQNTDANRGWKKSLNQVKVSQGQNLARVYYFNNWIIQKSQLRGSGGTMKDGRTWIGNPAACVSCTDAEPSKPIAHIS